MTTHAFVPTAAPKSPAAAALSQSLASATVSPTIPTSAQPAVSRRMAPSPAHNTTTGVPTSQPPPTGGSPGRIAVWHLADLRTADNPALTAAARASSRAGPTGACVPLIAGLPARRAAAAATLREELEAAGSGLVAMASEGGVVEVCRRLRLEAVYFNRAIAVHDVRVQIRVEEQLRRAGIQVRAFWGNALRAPEEADVSAEKEVGCGALYLRGGAVEEPAAAPERLPRLPSAAASLGDGAAGLPLGGAGKAGAKGRIATQVLAAACTKRGERAVGASAGGGDPALLLKDLLDSGALSARMVAAHLKSVVGKYEGKTYGELVFRDYASVAAHRALGAKSAAQVHATA